MAVDACTVATVCSERAGSASCRSSAAAVVRARSAHVHNAIKVPIGYGPGDEPDAGQARDGLEVAHDPQLTLF